MHKCHSYMEYFFQNLRSSNGTVHINAFTNENMTNYDNADNACIGGLLEKSAHIWIYVKELLCSLKDDVCCFFNVHQLKIIIQNIR